MLDKLAAVANRYEEICARSEQPDFYADPKKAAAILRERNDLEPVVTAFQAYQQAQQDMDDAQELMNDPERFTLLLPRYAGVGTWGDDTFGFWDLSSKITQFELPWQTVMEEHYPLLEESIKQANGAYNPQ